MEVYKNRKIATCNNNEDIICSIRLDLQAYPEMKILMEQAGAELGQAQLQLELGFTLIKVCCISLMITN